MTITAEVVADSICEGRRITTMKLRYPRFIHAEELTHRVLNSGAEVVVPDGFMYDQDLSRNASSSRAIPVPRVVQDVMDDPAMPIHWGKNQPGMQAREEHDAPISVVWQMPTPQDVRYYSDGMTAEEAWLYARDRAVEAAKAFHEAGYHKQIVNRLLEPFSHINVVVTATRWDNFFALRLHPDAQPEIHELAKQMRAAMDASTPRLMGLGEWHLPFMKDEDRIGRTLWEQVQISAARCARVSYLTHDGKPTDPEADTRLAADLWQAEHLSPFEHPASPYPGGYANFDGWISARHFEVG